MEEGLARPLEQEILAGNYCRSVFRSGVGGQLQEDRPGSRVGKQGDRTARLRPVAPTNSMHILGGRLVPLFFVESLFPQLRVNEEVVRSD